MAWDRMLLAFQGKSLSIERFPSKQRLRSWTEDSSEKSEKAGLVARSQWVLSFPWTCPAGWGAHSQLWNLSHSEFYLSRMWPDERTRRKHSLLASQKPLLVLAEVSKDCYLKLGIFKFGIHEYKHTQHTRAMKCRSWFHWLPIRTFLHLILT